MTGTPLKIAVIAGEVSGDLLGGDLVEALRRRLPNGVSLVGVGGESLHRQGLQSLFDYSELSIMGLTQVLARLPSLVRRIRQTADAIVAEKPDVLIIIDSPDFTHRVARKVRRKLPDLPIVNYVCPSVWAWKEERARQMVPYVDHVLAVLPFEPEVMARLGGPPTTYVGHRLSADDRVQAIRRQQLAKEVLQDPAQTTCLLLPGSRSTEIVRLMPLFAETVQMLATRNPGMRFLLPTVSTQEALVRELTADWAIKPVITATVADKWKAFSEADVALAASGTVILELALAGVPAISCYKVDWLVKLMAKRIKTWTAALPNLIADYVIVPEYLNEAIRPAALARAIERFSCDTLQRRAVMEGYALVHRRMQTEMPPGEHAAAIVLELLTKKKPGHF
ncbi:lipid-A-disaccharide synthase [Sinorhizobium sp. BG8]|uniref:lipid-A-disaccharide synthase n=1 Tax=Sinorhizobium sp. BG8 TaxID=2613773 RepID=UPI00193D2DE9|nr:lipid-A-disaccharide synthase [Sinorhizobium sp. BG8]QRM55534.1 lipid-A-disaccharide synthase [Sinorhizobium sp. BG8]